MEKELIDLILQAQSGEQSAFSVLKDRYRPLIDSCAYRFVSEHMTEQDCEDISQEALVHFCNSVCSYNCNLDGIEFGLYAKICIENGLVSFIRLYNRQNRLRALPLEGEAQLSEDRETDILQSLIDRESTALLTRQINRCLSNYEARIWWMYVSGMSVSSIADEISVDRKSVSNAIYRIRKKLRDLIPEQNFR